jgi:hypothetical protein
LQDKGQDGKDGKDGKIPPFSARDEKLPDWVTEDAGTPTVEEDLDRLFETGGEP